MSEKNSLEIKNEHDEAIVSSNAEKSSLLTRLKSKFSVSSNGTSYSKEKASTYLNILKKLPFTLLGDYVQERKDKYENLQLKLFQARIPLSYEMYVSNAIFYSLLSCVFGLIIGIFVAYISIYVVGLPEAITKLEFSESSAWILQFKGIFVGFLIMLFFAASLGGGIYGMFMLYPKFQASERKGDIDRQLPYAVTFMYALSKGGMNIIEVFRLLSRSGSTYGEVSKEINAIIREMDYFGYDMKTAISNISERSPSDRFNELMDNLITIIDSGGSIPRYFQDKAEQYLQKTSIDEKGFLETLGLLAESYVTAFVAGPLFIIIMGVMMAVMGSGSEVMVYAIIYAVLPIGSLMFVVMISIITPSEMGEPELLPTRTILEHGIPVLPSYLEPVYDDAGELINDTEDNVRDREYYLNFAKAKKLLSVRKFAKNPFDLLMHNPLYSLAVTIPIAILVLVIPFWSNIGSLVTTAQKIGFIDDYIVLALFIAIVPMALFHEIMSRKKKHLERNFPDFLKKLASTNETGMTLRDSIKLMAKSKSGHLGNEIRMIWADISWGMNVNDSLIRFANRLRTQVIARSLTLITKANESSGDVGEVLLVAARDAASEQSMKRERAMSMMIYIVIIYISFLVFVGVIYVISTTFLAEMAAAGEKMTESGGAGGFLGSFDLEGYTRLFMHASLIQGLSSGLMAGAMGEGSVMSGLKHSIIMMGIGYLIFTVFV
ncbi:type II secretion system F family protein [Methanococcoides burtonii]|uniref:Type II secretion system protein F domain n=1 Tax=Methanococcoides burtonii (strain DSM 6242 / NBRC 107633 / OCM 468 / ACE-M) TaxID=259564 RepID=Q12YP0_METBU|nr:type II secretion system F family protein [Methanococcoides burtonii]ABE51436.1 type II secretion system protein F domain [Methanococcoides burtonii DSM 6242]